MSVKEWVRESMYSLLYSLTGPGKGIRVILLYHSIGGRPPYGVSRLSFEQQIAALVERFKIVRLCDLQETISTEPEGMNIACITFDDGCQDNYEVALPILERYGIKATFFIVTGLLGQTIETSTGEYDMMNVQQVRDLVSLGHEIGAHTVHHYKLTQVPLHIAWQEIEDSKTFLEDLLGSPVCSFAYPKGDYNQAVQELVRQAQFQFAVTIREGLVDNQPDWLALPRIWISGRLSLKSFKARLSPATRIYRRWRRG